MGGKKTKYAAADLTDKIRKNLIKRGFDIASSIGIRGRVESDHVGILRDAGGKRADFLGVIWVENFARKADKKNWVLDMYGTQNKTLLEELVRDLEKSFKVEISFNLIGERGKFEHLTGY